ncbi:hypothetical protein ACFYYH_31270 [Streptomyces sp. NPDC002018]
MTSFPPGGGGGAGNPSRYATARPWRAAVGRFARPGALVTGGAVLV